MIRKIGLAVSAAMLAGLIAGQAQADNPPLPNLVNLDFTQ